jgi:hypothetical protein
MGWQIHANTFYLLPAKPNQLTQQLTAKTTPKPNLPPLNPTCLRVMDKTQ